MKKQTVDFPVNGSSFKALTTDEQVFPDHMNQANFNEEHDLKSNELKDSVDEKKSDDNEFNGLPFKKDDHSIGAWCLARGRRY